MDLTERKKLLERAWTDVAAPYLREFAPRFAPWAQQALEQLRSRAAELPPGPVVCAACGPGHELPLLCEALPGRRIVGVDLSQGMCEVARQLAADRGLLAGGGACGPVHVLAGDACSLEWATGSEPPSAVYSVFGLQQMPQQAKVLAAWTRALAPGGLLSVCFWPRQLDEGPEGPAAPFQRLFDLSADTVARNAEDWEAGIPGLALAEGAELLLDARPRHTMEWPSAEAFIDRMFDSGPWRSRQLAMGGEAAAAELRRRFLEAFPDPCAPLLHSPCARLVVLRKKREARGPSAAL